jgi:ribosomal protein S12 methylthiotransferase accessory factor
MLVFGRELSARKTFYRGTHRTRDPAQTVETYSRLMPELGITRLANVAGLDRIGLPTYVAVRPNSRSLATSQGKGETRAAAKASALMESIESWHAERIDAPLRHASYDELRSAAHVVDITQIGARASVEVAANRPLLWIEGWDLMAERPAWVPFETVSTNFVMQPGEQQIFHKGTNGLASGNHPLEAIVHALCEVIERDAILLWTMRPEAQHKSRQIDLARLAEAETVVAAWDVTSDVGLPTFTATIVEDPGSPAWRGIGVFSGHGSHPQPSVALSRAICEAIQIRVTMISGSRDDMFPRDYLGFASREVQEALVRDFREPAPAFPFAAAPPPSETFEDDLRGMLAALRAVGIESVVAVDLSRPEIGVPVVKVVVPGLEGMGTPPSRLSPRARRLVAAMANA